VVDEDLLDLVTLTTKSYGTTAQLSIGKDIDIVRRVTSHLAIGHLYMGHLLLTNIGLGGQLLLMWLREECLVDSPIAILGVTRAYLVCTIAPTLVLFA